MNKKEVKNIIITLGKRARATKRKCCFDTCEEQAIESHLLQKNGILNQISGGTNQVVELAIDHYQSDKFVFKPIGLNIAFTFPGFCNKHDSEIFKAVETKKIDYNDYLTQLLFSYRASMNEKRKKETVIDWYNRILNSSNLKLYIEKEFLEYIEQDKQQQLLGIQDESYYEKIFLANIKNPSLRNFMFMTYELPKIEICASGVFTYETTFEISHINEKNINDPLTQIYFNLLPMEDKTIVILGCERKMADKCWEYISEYKIVDKKLALKKISNLLINQVENWLCSQTFYKHHLKNKEKDIVRLTKEAIKNINERRDLDFNLFESIELE